MNNLKCKFEQTMLTSCQAANSLSGRHSFLLYFPVNVKREMESHCILPLVIVVLTSFYSRF